MVEAGMPHWQDPRRAVAAGVIDTARAEALWTFREERPGTGLRPRFDLAHLLCYAGALIVIGATGLFTSLSWVFGADWDSWDQRRIVSLWFGLAMLGLA